MEDKEKYVAGNRYVANILSDNNLLLWVSGKTKETITTLYVCNYNKPDSERVTVIDLGVEIDISKYD